MKCNTKISRFDSQSKPFDKTSANKTKSPTLPTKYPAWHAGLRQSRGFFMPPKRQSLKSRAEPPTGDAALYKGRSLSSLKASPAWYALQVGGRETKLRKLCARADRSLRPDHTNNSLGELSVNIIPQFVQKEKPACIAVQAGSIFRPPL